MPISYSTERLAFDRRSGLLVNCCGAEIGTKRVKMSGQGFVWPIGVQQRNYQIFDTTLLKPETAQFVGTSTVDGLNVYVFVENVNNQQFGSITLPGSLVGITDQPTVTLPEYLSSNVTYYVDPGTGSPVKLVESQNNSLSNPSTGATALILLQGHADDNAPEHCRGRQHGEVVGQRDHLGSGRCSADRRSGRPRPAGARPAAASRGP